MDNETYISADSAADCAVCAGCGVVDAGVLSLVSDSSVVDVVVVAGVVVLSVFFALNSTKKPNESGHASS